MPVYRLYFVNKANRIEERREVEAPDDAKAIGLADRQGDGRGMELWDGARLVKKFEPARS